MTRGPSSEATKRLQSASAKRRWIEKLGTLNERLDARTQKTPTDWFWTGTVVWNGHRYGILAWDGRLHLAHRLMYERYKGPIPEGLELDHLCRIRHCVNPDHLEPVTHQENVRRGIWPPRKEWHCKYGHPKRTDTFWVRSDGSHHCLICSRDRKRVRRKIARAALPVPYCLWCGNEIQLRRFAVGRKFCSANCRQRDYYKRKHAHAA